MENTANNGKTLEELKKELEAAQKAYATMQDIVNKREAEETQKRKDELAREKENRKKIIEAKEKELHFLIREYIKDYGAYSYSRDMNNEDVFTRIQKLFF